MRRRGSTLETGGLGGLVRAAVVTVVSRNHLHRTNALMASLAEVDPKIVRFACIVDPPPPELLAGAQFEPILAEERLDIADFRRRAFKYSPFELVTALKPWAIAHVLETTSAEYVVYLDSDIQVYAPFDDLRATLDRHPVVLTPHLTEPPPEDGFQPDQQTILRAGAFNAGFAAVRRSPVAAAFLDWWKALLRDDCFVDMAGGVFVDQRWLDLAPGLFAGVHVERNRGYNVAYWNLPERTMSRADDGTVTVDGGPLYFFHFSGLPDDPADERLSTHTNRPGLQTPIVSELVAGYRQRIDASASRGQVCDYAFATLADGTPIKREWREAMRRRHPSLDGFADPFAPDIASELVPRLVALEGEMSGLRLDWRLERISEFHAEIARMNALQSETLGKLRQTEERYAALRAYGPVRRLLGRRRMLSRLLGKAEPNF